MSNDLTFFTNEPNATLSERFNLTLKNVQYFDILVGYFRTSGFHLLHEALADIEKIRILVGMNLDAEAFEIIDSTSRKTQRIDFDDATIIKDFSDNLVDEIDNSQDSYDTELGIQKFIEFIKYKKLEIRVHPSKKIHAKVYISRFKADDRDYGRVITGSSNFSHSGLMGNYEFNVELKNKTDVEYAHSKFEDLWQNSVPVSEEYIDVVKKRTWLNNEITPYQIYLKFLYEYFKEDINLDEEFEIYLPDGFLELKYQKQAVLSAKKILDSYNGVFLSDVVGLGKTYISAMLAQQLPGRKLIICPPVLQDYWRETFLEFGIGGAVIESIGKLDHIIQSGHEKFDYVFVDEAHRFRNTDTQRYEKLHQICWGKKVILISATPLNNQIEDIFAQITLFQAPRKSIIPGVPNLDNFFVGLRKQLDQEEKGTPEYFAMLKDVANKIRNSVLKYIMVRRTRNEIMRYFDVDMSSQGLSFPQLATPERIVYEFDTKTDAIFNQTIDKLKSFKYARYMPLTYMKQQLSAFELQSQRNIGSFMKGILVKRLESSFFAFKNTLRRFIESYEKFINMFDKGTVYISKQVDVYDLLGNDDEQLLLSLLEEGKVSDYLSKNFAPNFRNHLVADLELLQEISILWEDISIDPKLDKFINELRGNPLLKRKKVVIFSESSETVRYLYDNLETEFPDKVLAFSSAGGIYHRVGINKIDSRRIILANYDPRQRNPENEVDILITTDVLAEGINLHRSNIVINYDLPWNPTRVLQRSGRVNRIGTEHKHIYIFNFFPTAQSNIHIRLEDNIKAKIQAFHDTLGEDAKYLTDEETITQHELFGDNLYKRLNRKETYSDTEEQEEHSELEYLQEIRAIRDNNPDLFNLIKHLPKKARSGKRISAQENVEKVVTFFRKGALKKFFLASSKQVLELSFLEAVSLLRVQNSNQNDPREARIYIPQIFYELLQQNKDAFIDTVTQAVSDLKSPKGGRSNEFIVLQTLKSLRSQRMTDDDEVYLKQVINALQNGNIPKKTSKRIKEEIERNHKINSSNPELNAIQILNILRQNISNNILDIQVGIKQNNSPNEVILSVYLLAESK